MHLFRDQKAPVNGKMNNVSPLCSSRFKDVVRWSEKYAIEERKSRSSDNFEYLCFLTRSNEAPGNE